MREALAVAAGLEGEYLALTKSVHLLTYSRSGLQLLSRGLANQAMALAAEVWSLLNTLADSGIETVCSSGAGPHAGLDGNETADRLAGEASAGDQGSAPIDLTSVRAAVTPSRLPHALGVSHPLPAEDRHTLADTGHPPQNQPG